jgi:hypothetical protein
MSSTEKEPKARKSKRTSISVSPLTLKTFNDLRRVTSASGHRHIDQDEMMSILLLVYKNATEKVEGVHP